jgi:hypothetical protein
MTMFGESTVPESRSRGPVTLVLAGVATLLGYYGLPWWAGWPATATLEAFERVFTISERGAAWQLGGFAVAAAVNILSWAVLIAALRRIWAGRTATR